MSKQITVIVMVLLSGLLCRSLYAEPDVNHAVAGRIIVAAGGVSAVTREGAVRELTRRSSVYVGETLHTDQYGRAQLKFRDGAVISLRENTALTIDQFVYQENDPSQRRSFFTLVKGGFRAISGVIGKQDAADYRVDTPLATIGIRGTHYEAVLTDSLGVAVWDGGVTLHNEGGLLKIGEHDDYRFAVVSQASMRPEGWLIPPMGIQGADLNVSGPDTPKRPQVGPEPGAINQLMNDRRGGHKPVAHQAPSKVENPIRFDQQGEQPLAHHHPMGIQPHIDNVVNEVGIDVNQDFRLTADEVGSLDKLGVITIDRQTQWADGIFIGKASTPDDGDFVFKDADTATNNVVIRRRDVSPVYASAVIGGEVVDWGVWNAALGHSAGAYLDETSGSLSVGVNDPVSWVVGTATEVSVVSAEVGLSNYNAVVAFQGFESGAGLSTPGVAYIDMDFSAGTFNAQLSYTGVGAWNMTYSGVGVDSKIVGTGTGTYTGGAGTQAASGQINGVFVGNAADGVMGGFKNHVVGNPSMTSSGTFVLQR